MPAQVTTSREITWASVIRKADPDFDKEKLKEPAYEFSSGRVFTQRQNPYA